MIARTSLLVLAALLLIATDVCAQQSNDRFKQWDTNNDGKLSKDELSEQMRSRFDRMDADHDGFVTLSEMTNLSKTRTRSELGSPPPGERPRRDAVTTSSRNISIGPTMADTPLGKVVGQVSSPQAVDTWNDQVLMQRVAAEAVERRKQMLIEAGAADEFNRRGTKHMFPVVLARLAINPNDRDALAYIPLGMTERSHSDFFGRSSLSRIWYQFGSQLSPQVADDLRKDVAAYEDYLTGGTENHIAMKRSSGLLFGEQFPDDAFAGGRSGRDVANQCREYMRTYGQSVYAHSMNEFLSPTYHAVNTAPWLNVAEFSRDDSSRLMADAILDWMFADLALNYNHGLITPPFQRANGYMEDSYQLNYARTQTAWTAWLYFGGGLTPNAPSAKFPSESYKPLQPYGMSGVLHAMSPYMPHPAIRNLGAKRLASPFMTWQSREIRPGTFPQLRSSYASQNYTIGTGNFSPDVSLRFTQPFAVSWTSKDERNYLMAQHPYWFTGGTSSERGGAPQFDGEDWMGTSPFCQSVHWENAAVLLYDIPTNDPFTNADFNDRGAAVQGGRTKTVAQSVFIYVPKSIDQQQKVGKDFFFREGDVYIALRPLRDGAAWVSTVKEGYVRLELPAKDHLTGFAIEVGDQAEFGSFEKFQRSVAAAVLNTTKLDRNKEVVYTSTRGHALRLQHQAVPNETGTWYPNASINGTKIDFTAWPVSHSPYVTCKNGVLDIHDGHSGMTIDWSGDLPKYTYFDLAGGKRVVTGTKAVQNGKLVVAGKD